MSPARLLAACLFAVLSAAPGRAQQGQDLWHRLGPARLGAEQAMLAVPLDCDEAVPVSTCRMDPGRAVADRFAGIAITGLEARFRAGRLERVRVSLDERDYAALLDTLRERLGEPEDRSFRARAGMGGQFEAGVKLWVSAETVVVLEQYAGKIDRGALTYGDAGAMRELVAQKRAYPPGAMRDL